MIKTLQNPRYEDYDYEYVNRKNRFTFLGNSMIETDVDDSGDKCVNSTALP